MIRRIIIPENEHIVIRIPKEYIHQKTEILLLPFDNDETMSKTNDEDIDRLSWNMGKKHYTRDGLYER